MGRLSPLVLTLTHHIRKPLVAETWTLYIDITCFNEIHRRNPWEWVFQCIFWHPKKEIFVKDGETPSVKKIFVKDGQTPSVESGQGESKKLSRLEKNLRDLSWSQVCLRNPGFFQPWIPGTSPGTSPGFPSKFSLSKASGSLITKHTRDCFCETI